MHPTAAALLLGDARFPAGGHAHSGGIEESVQRWIVVDAASLAGYLAGRLATTGALAASAAAAVCHRCTELRERPSADDGWQRLWLDTDEQVDARTPSPAGRAASRTQGAQLLRGALAVLGGPALASLRRLSTPGPHHCAALGAASASAGLAPADAAATAAYLSVAGPASAAVRLLGLDPFDAARAVSGLTAAVDQVAAEAARGAARPLDELPAPNAPATDLLAEAHARRKERLFAS
jgi:urease accessory protein